MQNVLFILRKYIKDIVLFGLVFICFGLIIYNEMSMEDLENNEIDELAITQDDDEHVVEENKTINVDIKGAVKNPGVYSVDDNTIINEIISLAGGFKSNAYKNGINLSKKVSDEMVIYVYTNSEINAKKDSEEKPVAVVDDICNTPNYSICECVEEQVSIIEVTPSKDSTTDSNTNVTEEPDNTKDENTLININIANTNELTTISGIGESKAEAIVKYRQENGNFSNITDIMNVSGIGEALFAKIKDFITV